MIQYNNELVYPKLCAVFKLPTQQFVYPIFKNASSSLEEICVQKIYNSNINKHTQALDVYWRDAQSRYNSGVNTYLQHNKFFDRQTIIHLIERQELVNRHFMPQYMWLCHLYKYYTGTITIKNINSLDISVHTNQSKFSSSFIAPTHWIDLDNMIMDRFADKPTVFEEINQYIETKSRVLYKTCIAQD